MKSAKTTTTIRLVEHGETTVQVDTDEYLAAIADGTLDELLDVQASDIDTDTLVIEPDGTLRTLYSDEAPRVSLLAADRSVTDAVALILASAPPSSLCLTCRSGRACHTHLAAALLDAIRQEDMVLMTLSKADQILKLAVRTAMSEVAAEIDRDGGTVLTARWAADLIREKAGLPIPNH